MTRHKDLWLALSLAVGIHVGVAGLGGRWWAQARERLHPVFEQGISSVALTLVAPRVPEPEAVLETPLGEPPEPEPVPVRPEPVPAEMVIAAVAEPDEAATVTPEAPAETQPEATQETELPSPVQEPIETAPFLDDGVLAISVERTGVRPRYPLGSRMRGEQGLVSVRARVGPDGRARDVAVARGSGFPALDRAAMSAGRKAVFVDDMGRVAGGEVELSFRFKLVD